MKNKYSKFSDDELLFMIKLNDEEDEIDAQFEALKKELGM